MNTRYASVRLPSVARVDSITTSQGDFLATHVALKKLMLPERFSLNPTTDRIASEEEVFRNIIQNPQNRHQFVVVYGQSGTGKSHLIRWLDARFEQVKPDDEVVLFVRRSDNTLKGTIRQLIEKPEVADIANRQIYERLVRASATVDEAKLKDMIYHNFIIEVDHDDGSRDRTLMNIKRKRLSAFLNNEVIHQRMMRADGPVERVYSKVAQGASVVDRDVVAQFLPEDFEVSAELFEIIARSGADSKVEKLAKALMADEDGAELGRELAGYMNQFVNDVVQRCAGIEPGDFRDIFNEIRRELFRLSKNLTLFIEDVTSFTGVDDALLDALIVDHSGMNAADGLCRISSIVGTTSNYLQNNFRDNHKDRITNFVYIPNGILDEAGVTELIARYLNAMSLPEQAIQDWLTERGADVESYPVHEPTDAVNWESVTIANGRALSLYPFTGNSIRYLYEHALTKGQQTPRYIIRDIIEPVVRDVLNDKAHFPGEYCALVGYDQNLPELIGNQIPDKDEQRRMLRFLSIWGNGKPEISMDGGRKRISDLPEAYFGEFGLPTIQFARTAGARTVKAQQPDKPSDNVSPSQAGAIPEEKRQRFELAFSLLQRWENGEPIDFSINTGAIGVLRSALDALNNYALTAINWLDWGVPSEHMARIKRAKAKLIGLERQTRGECMYALPSTWESVYLICALIRYNEYGKGSWDYPDAGADAYRLSAWTEKVRGALIDVVRKLDGRPVNYIDAAIIAEIYRLILSGEYGERSLKNLTAKDLLENKRPKSTAGHTDKWLSLLKLIDDRDAGQQNRRAIRQYFDLPQGEGGRIIVLNEPELLRAFSRVKQSRLTLADEDVALLEGDPMKPRRDVYDYMKKIRERIDEVAQQEKLAGENCLREIASQLDCDEIEDDNILDFVELVEDFYTEANEAQFNVTRPTNLEVIRKSAARTVQAINAVRGVSEERDPLNILMAYSGEQNPILLLSRLCELLRKLTADLNKVSNGVALRRADVADVASMDCAAELYGSQFNLLDADLSALAEGR